MSQQIETDYGTKDMDTLLQYYEIDHLSSEDQLKALRYRRMDAHYEIQFWHDEYDLMDSMIDAIETDRPPGDGGSEE
jgi:hypothetical protein